MRPGILLDSVTKRWYCPRCTETTATKDVRPHTPFHSCRGMKGLTTPFVEEGTKAKVVACEREDYVGRETVQTDGEGRPIMAVTVTQDEREDRAVLAPCATLGRD